MISNKIIKQFNNNCNLIFVIAAVLTLFGAFMHYNSMKNIDSMSGYSQGANNVSVVNSGGKKAVQAANPLGTNEVYSSVKGIGTSQNGLPPSCAQQVATKPGDLLPKDKHNDWAKMNPTGNGDLKNVNLLKAGYHIGINTVGNSLRNANLQIRSEPANPQMNTGPWNTSTIEPSSFGLDVGSCASSS